MQGEDLVVAVVFGEDALDAERRAVLDAECFNFLFMERTLVHARVVLPVRGLRVCRLVLAFERRVVRLQARLEQQVRLGEPGEGLVSRKLSER